MRQISDWTNDPPSSLAPDGSRPTNSIVLELPEVQALIAQGWRLAPEAPVWSFLPAVWPKEHRTWVPDRALHLCVVVEGSVARTEQLTRAELDELDADAAQLCARAGIASRPPRRIWLLRDVNEWSPERVCSEAVARVGEDFYTSPALTRIVQEILEQAMA